MKKIIFLISSILILNACSKEDVDPQLNGTWFLSSVSCFCFHDPETDFSGYTLEFIESEKRVNVKNPSGENYYIAEDGSRKYSISNQVITIEGATYSYKYSIENNELFLHNLDNPQIADDEITLVFRRK